MRFSDEELELHKIQTSPEHWPLIHGMWFFQYSTVSVQLPVGDDRTPHPVDIPTSQHLNVRKAVQIYACIP